MAETDNGKEKESGTGTQENKVDETRHPDTGSELHVRERGQNATEQWKRKNTRKTSDKMTTKRQEGIKGGKNRSIQKTRVREAVKGEKTRQ